LTGFSNLTKPLLLLLLSKDYYKKVVISIVVATDTMNWWTVFAFNAISRAR